MKMRKFSPKYFPWAVRVFLAISLLVMALVAVTIAALSGLLKSEIVEMERESLQKQVEQLSGMVDQLCLVQLQKTTPFWRMRIFFSSYQKQRKAWESAISCAVSWGSS